MSRIPPSYRSSRAVGREGDSRSRAQASGARTGNSSGISDPTDGADG